MPIALLMYWKEGIMIVLLAVIVGFWIDHKILKADLRDETSKYDACKAQSKRDQDAVNGFSEKVTLVQRAAEEAISKQKADSAKILSDYSAQLQDALRKRQTIPVPKDCEQGIKYANHEAQELGRW